MDATSAMFWSAIAGALFGGGVTATTNYFTAKHLFKVETFEKEAQKFRDVIFEELKGLYPTNQNWQDKDVKGLQYKIPAILAAASKFKPHVQNKSSFEGIIMAFQSHCHEIKNESFNDPRDLAFGCTLEYEKNKKKGGFQYVVDTILSFTERKSTAQRIRNTLRNRTKSPAIYFHRR